MATCERTTLERIDQRLDALDRALWGLLPRGERLEFVAGLEEKLRKLHDSDPNAFEDLAATREETSFVRSAARSGTPTSRRKRSRLALTSGILGIVALSLLLVLPVSYVVIASCAQMIGEFLAISLIVLNVLVIAGGGAAAVTMGIAALIRLSRSNGRKHGYGWAITGLCTAALPMLVGTLGTLSFAVPMAMEMASNGAPVISPPQDLQPIYPPPLPPDSLPPSMPTGYIPPAAPVLYSPDSVQPNTPQSGPAPAISLPAAIESKPPAAREMVAPVSSESANQNSTSFAMPVVDKRVFIRASYYETAEEDGISSTEEASEELSCSSDRCMMPVIITRPDAVVDAAATSDPKPTASDE